MTADLHPGMDDLIQYSMGTLDAESAERVRLHAEQCADCQAELARLRTDLALTAMAVPQVVPPARAKDRLFQAVGIDLDQITRAATLQSGPGVNTAPAEAENVVPIHPRRVGATLAWVGWVAAAACLFYAVEVHETDLGMRQQIRAQIAEIQQSHLSAARAQEVLDVLSSPQAQRVTLVAAHAVPEPAGHAVYLPARGALVFTASNLRPLPANKTYELWVIPANGKAPVPAGTFQPDARGMASVLLPNLPRGLKAKAFGVTMENSGGSATPTLPILLAGG